METETQAYIRSLRPVGFPDGRKLLEEGRALGAKISVPRTWFLEKHGCKSYLEYRRKRLAEGKQTWQLLLGLATLKDQLAAIRKIEDFNRENAALGMEISGVQSIPSQIVGLPHDYWATFRKQTSYEMVDPADWRAHTEAAPIQVAWQDFHLASPAALQTTINALEAGTDRLGCFSTFTWDYAGYHDEVNRFSDMVRSLGILSTKKDLSIDVVTYPEDGIPGFLMDVVSWVGYTMVEHYITTKLCGALFSVSYGGLLTDVHLRMAFALAMDRLFSTPDHPGVVYYNGGTVDQLDRQVNANFGTSVPELLMQTLVNLKYNLPIILSPVAVTEALRTPSIDELIDIAAAGMRAETKAKEWLPLMDFSPIEAMADKLVEKGTLFYDNVMTGFREAGVDIEDPLEMIMVLKRFSPSKFEQMFHPSIAETGAFTPYFRTQLGQMTLEIKDRIVAELKQKNLSLGGRKVVCASADSHGYGLLLLDTVYREINGMVVNGGVDMEPSTVLDLADEEDTDLICVSCHCGQGLAFAHSVTRLAQERGRKYRVVIGGMLNALLPGKELPEDVAALINETGVCGTNDFEEALAYLLEAA